MTAATQDKNLYRIRIAGAELQVLQHTAAPGLPYIVFLHDSLGCIALWRDFPARLAAVVPANYMIYDRRGYGGSDPMADEPRQTDYMETEADILVSLLDKLGIERPWLFGHSDGGTIALLAAARYPERFRGIITEGAHVFVEEITLDGIALAKEQYRSTNLRERLERYHGANTQALFDAWTETWLSPAYRDWNIEHFLPSVQCPALVIQGVEDEYGSAAQVAAIVDKTGGPAEACMVVNAGHSPHRQNELWLIDRCCAFIHTYDKG